MANHCLGVVGVGLKAILTKASLLDRLQTQLEPYLESHIRPYCLVANQIGSTLVLLVSNGAIATALRFQQHSLLQRFQGNADLSAIKAITIKVSPFSRLNPLLEEKETAMPSPMAPLSKESATAMQQAAKDISDPALKAILQRIAAHTH